ncbi:MAG: hypothetical protein Fur0032_03980 [Terrimicrobiaceae bacterium]
MEKPGKFSAWILAGLGFAAVAVPWLGIISVAIFLPPILPTLRELGPLLAVPYILLAGLLVGLALAPTHLTSLLSGYLFGALLGIPVACLAVGIGTMIGFHTARKLARTRLRELLDQSRWGRLLLGEMIDTSPWKAAAAITLARLPPQVPFAVGNLLAASARAPLAPVLVGTLVGMFPRVALVALVGSQLAEWKPGAPVPSGLIWTGAATAIGFGSLALWGAAILRRKGSQDRSR